MFVYVLHVYCIEWDRPDQKETSYILYEGCGTTPEANGEVDVCYQLHGDGQGHWCTPKLPVNKRSTNKGRLSTAETGQFDSSTNLH